MKVIENITLCRFSNGQVAVARDSELPLRAEAIGSIEIEEWMSRDFVSAIRGGVMVDVGAFVGDTAIKFIEQGCDVYAFEPFFDAYACLCINAPSAKKFNVAVGDGESVILDHHVHGGNLGSRMVRSDPSGTPTLKLDSLNLQRCDFLKIDCEGREPFVLRGAREMILRCRPVMWIECYAEILAIHGESRNGLHSLIEQFRYTLDIIGDEPRYDILCRPK